MLIALINDTHIGARSDSLVVSKYTEKFFSEVFFPNLKARSVTKIVHLGDIFDRRKYVSFSVLDQAKRYLFDPLREEKIQMDIIVGNHDLAYKNTNDLNSPMLLLREYDNIKVFKETEEQVIDGTPVIFVPWINDGNKAESLLRIKNSRARFLFGHLHMKGFEINRGHVAEDGLEAGEFGNFDGVFSGHFHKKSNIGNVYYLGTQFEMTWSDFDDYKGFHYLDTDTGTLEFIVNPHKLHHKIFYDDSKTIVDPHSDMIKDHYIKLIVRSKSDPYLFEKFTSALTDMQPANLIIVEEREISIDPLELENIQVEDTPTILKRFVEAIEDKHIPKVKLVNLLSQLYLEAQDLNTGAD